MPLRANEGRAISSNHEGDASRDLTDDAGLLRRGSTHSLYSEECPWLRPMATAQTIRARGLNNSNYRHNPGC